MQQTSPTYPGPAGGGTGLETGQDEEWRGSTPSLSWCSSTNRLVNLSRQSTLNDKVQPPSRRSTMPWSDAKSVAETYHNVTKEDIDVRKSRTGPRTWPDGMSESGTTARGYIEVERVLHNNGLKLRDDGQVGWDFDSPHCTHPRTWTTKRKLWDFAVIALVESFTLAMSSVGAPISSKVYKMLNVSSTMSSFIFTSLYLFGQAVGVIIVPASESFGRKNVYVGGMFFFACFSLLIGLSPNPALIAICRFVTGVLAAIPMNGIFGSMADLWDYRDRLWIGWVGAMAANAGIIMGPAFADTILDEDDLGWHWVFNIATIVALFLTAVLCTTFESRPSVLLHERTNQVRKLLSDPSLLPASHPDHVKSIGEFATKHMSRPFRLLWSEPIILFISMLIGSSFAVIFMFLEAIPFIFESFGLDESLRTLPFLGLALGLVFSTYTRMYDHHLIARHLGHEHKGEPLTPELKLIGFLIGSWVFASGLWLFSWTIPPYSAHTPITATWALVMIGYGINEFDTVLTGYLMDAYLSYAGSALAALNFFRTITIGVCSIFAHELFREINWNIAGSVLAIAASLFCIAPPLLMRYGEGVRCRSKFAVFSAVITLEERLAGNALTATISRATSPERII